MILIYTKNHIFTVWKYLIPYLRSAEPHFTAELRLWLSFALSALFQRLAVSGFVRAQCDCQTVVRDPVWLLHLKFNGLDYASCAFHNSLWDPTFLKAVSWCTNVLSDYVLQNSNQSDASHSRREIRFCSHNSPVILFFFFFSLMAEQ